MPLRPRPPCKTCGDLVQLGGTGHGLCRRCYKARQRQSTRARRRRTGADALSARFTLRLEPQVLSKVRARAASAGVGAGSLVRFALGSPPRTTGTAGSASNGDTPEHVRRRALKAVASELAFCEARLGEAWSQLEQADFGNVAVALKNARTSIAWVLHAVSDLVPDAARSGVGSGQGDDASRLPVAASDMVVAFIRLFIETTNGSFGRGERQVAWPVRARQVLLKEAVGVVGLSWPPIGWKWNSASAVESRPDRINV